MPPSTRTLLVRCPIPLYRWLLSIVLSCLLTGFMFAGLMAAHVFKLPPRPAQQGLTLTLQQGSPAQAMPVENGIESKAQKSHPASSAKTTLRAVPAAKKTAPRHAQGKRAPAPPVLARPDFSLVSAPLSIPETRLSAPPVPHSGAPKDEQTSASPAKSLAQTQRPEETAASETQQGEKSAHAGTDAIHCTERPEPEFPAHAVKDDILAGEVTALLTIDEKGDVQSVHITKAVPEGYFERPVRQALAHWQCDSYGKNYQAIQKFVFKLNTRS